MASSSGEPSEPYPGAAQEPGRRAETAAQEEPVEFGRVPKLGVAARPKYPEGGYGPMEKCCLGARRDHERLAVNDATHGPQRFWGSSAIPLGDDPSLDCHPAAFAGRHNPAGFPRPWAAASSRALQAGPGDPCPLPGTGREPAGTSGSHLATLESSDLEPAFGSKTLRLILGGPGTVIRKTSRGTLLPLRIG